jgi:RNA polymerase sigma-70 factor (ECF subfamily)
MAVDGELQRCVRTHYARLVSVVTIVTGSRDLAEDAVQEAFARAWERTQRGETFDHLAAWVATVALNYARSGRRRRRSERHALQKLGHRPPSLPNVDAPDIALVVRSALDGLAARQRDAVVLYYLLDVDVATTAALLGVSEGTVKTALSRARQRLAELLREPEMEV